MRIDFRFKICPPSEVNFGYQMIGSLKEQEIIITNTGKFSFNYVIMSLRKMLEAQAKETNKGKKRSLSCLVFTFFVVLAKKGKRKESKSSGSKKSKSSRTQTKSKSTKSKSSKKSSKRSKSSKSSKKAEKKKKKTKLDAGIFSLTSSTGEIVPNQSEIIVVTSKPKLKGVTEETVLFFISECSTKDKSGRPIVLKTEGQVPTLNFEDVDGIFREQFVVNKFDEFKCPADVRL